MQIIVPSTSQISALPSHLQSQYQTSTPPTNTPTPPTGTYGYQNQQMYVTSPAYSQTVGSTSGYSSYGGQSQTQPSYSSSYPQQAGQSSGYGTPSTSVGGRTQGTPVIEMLATFPEEQKVRLLWSLLVRYAWVASVQQLIMHVVSMTPEQLNSFPPEQRNTYIQIVSRVNLASNLMWSGSLVPRSALLLEFIECIYVRVLIPSLGFSGIVSLSSFSRNFSLLFARTCL